MVLIRDCRVTIREIEFSELDGICIWNDDEVIIGVKSSLDKKEKEKVIMHELYHGMLTDNSSLCDEDIECRARNAEKIIK